MRILHTWLFLVLLSGFTVPPGGLAELVLPAASAVSSQFKKFETNQGHVLEYLLAFPDEKRPNYPVLLALPPGSQDNSAVQWGWEQLYSDQAGKRGWVVISPAAAPGRPFYRQGKQDLIELLESILREFPAEGEKVHLAGVSNGGLASFRVAIDYPQRIQSIAVLPGWPAPGDLSKLDSLSSIPIKMWVGEKDNPSWIRLMEQARERLEVIGGRVELDILPGEGHTIQSLMGGQALFDFLDDQRPGH